MRYSFLNLCTQSRGQNSKNCCPGQMVPFFAGQEFNELARLDLDVILLQETHVSNKVQADEISKRWSGDCFWSFGTGRSAGVAMFVSPRFQGKISRFLFDSDGRVFSALIDFGSCKFNLVNVYAPNTVAGRRVFFQNLHQYFLCP